MSDPASPLDTEVHNPDGDDAVIGRALKWSLGTFLILFVGGAVTTYWFTRPAAVALVKATPLAPPQIREFADVTVPTLPWTDITESAGVSFVHENGAYGDKLLPETMGGGCAFFDFDADGHQDILLVNSCRWPWDPRPSSAPSTMGLFHNDGAGHFTDVTAGSGLDVSLYGMGVATGDYDNDGRVDVFLSALGPNRLFRNVGGRFVEITDSAGVAGDENDWSTSCGWFDYDCDGDLDLFVCNYLQWSKEYDLAQLFRLTGDDRAYGRPQAFEGSHCRLYRNNGDGAFTDVSAEAGIEVNDPARGVPLAKSLGVVFCDFDRDGRPDILVANDTVRNFLFHNQGNGTFLEIGRQAGVAYDLDGNARGAMGIDVAHFRNNDALGIAIGNFANEMGALYVAYGDALQFTDEAVSTGLGPQSRLQLTFGVFFFDCDLDSRLDLFSANGHLEQDIHKVQPSQRYEQSPQLFWNCGPEASTELVPVPASHTSEDFARPLVGRGASFADIDADGDLDVLITAVGQRPRLLRNDQNADHHWLRVKLTSQTCNRDAIGTWIELQLPHRKLSRHVQPTRSYLSQVELPLTFGLGPDASIECLTIRWPDGDQEVIENITIDKSIEITQGRGQE